IRKRSRPGDPKTWEEFVERDLVELSFGLGNVIALADYMIVNEGSLSELRREAEKVLEKCLEIAKEVK
ncbi:MAG: dephospho-CoA kinase, partial [Thermoprotei archaeon]|nr:dephospho-CoA kinase [Thermoprotei archaeon]